MSDALYQQIRQNLDRKSTAELKRIVAEQHTGDWSEDAVKAASELLAARPDEPAPPDVATPPVTALPVVETPPHRPDSLTPEEVASYRSKIQFLGWVFCIIGALFSAVILAPPYLFGWYKISPLAWLSFGVFGVIFGLALIITGTGLIRLKPGFRIPGIVLSVLVLLFPFATNYHSLDPVIGLGCIIIGVIGILWLGKRGSVLNSRPEKGSVLEI